MQTKSLKGGCLTRAGGPSGLEEIAMWLRTSMCLFPVTVAVVQQSVREVGSCSLDVRVRCCKMQGRRRWRRLRLKVGRGRRRALVEVRRPVEVVEPRRAERGGGDVRSGRGAEAADAANPLWAAMR